jgi:transcription initiation factor TFIIH subunit 4
MDIIKYLSELPQVTRRKLLSQPHCCLAVYRGLSEKDRVVVSRLIAGPCAIGSVFENEEKPESDENAKKASENEAEAAKTADEWNSNSEKSAPLQRSSLHSESGEKAHLILPALWKLGLLSIERTYLVLDDEFAETLYSALSEPHEGLTEVSLDSESYEPVDTTSLVEFAKLKWEQLVTPLLKLAHPSITLPARNRGSSAQLLRIMKSADLVNADGTVLLPEGYTFLLSEIPRQVWILANSFLSKELTPSHRADGISFLIFMATTPQSGRVYARNTLSEIQNQLLVEWEVFGLVKFVESTSTSFKATSEREYFTVTPLASAIIESRRSGISIGDWSSGIIVESNFYCYLYTNSSIMIALLQLFAQVTVRMPNMCVARLTRQSVREAFKKGIHAHHIIDYLRSNKHAAHIALQAANRPNASNARNAALSLAQALSSGNESVDMETMFPTSKTSGLPEQVEDQLNLWEEERFRFSSIAMVHWQFEAGVDDPQWYSATKEYARDMGALIWCNDKDQGLGVKVSSQESIVAFYKSLKKG